MSDTDLQRVEFYGTGLAGANLENANLLDARFDIHLMDDGTIILTNLDGAVLRNTQLAGSYLAGATLAGADLSGSNFSTRGSGPVVFADQRQVDGQQITLQAELAGANLSGANLQSANLQDANLQRTNLSGANFKLANLTGADLSQTSLVGTDLRAANLKGATLEGADLQDTNLAGANLSEAILTEASMVNTTFVTTVDVTFPVTTTYEQFLTFLFSSDCPNGIFLIVKQEVTSIGTGFSLDLGRSIFNNGIWRNAAAYVCAANLNKTTIRGTGIAQSEVYLAGVNLREADLQFSNLSKVIFNEILQVAGMDYPLEADLTGAIYNNFTIWPTNFVPPPEAIQKRIVPKT
jgi:uncharacterized protein YjbI with pentapeptide repeats